MEVSHTFNTTFSLAGCLYVMSVGGFPLSVRSVRVMGYLSTVLLQEVKSDTEH